ncbi:MAG TPA: glycoside hydrolase 43 family protein [Terracidiphilus sp.]|nr:glycoside hydrolase 43 family protein [Terracidiphilus sp.]
MRSGALFCAIGLAAGLLRLSAQRPVQAPMYLNPILFADYSDPDVIRTGSEYWLVASTFHFVPGVVVLHSRDLVHWSISGHVVKRMTMSPAYDMQDGVRYGRGVWAPALRFHNGLFYVYFPTPDEGIFVSTAPRMTGPWSPPVAVVSGPGYEDPCPFWDDDGQAYLIHSKTGAGPLILHRMSPDGMKVLDDGKEIVRDPKNLPTLEGPKMYKRDGWYYIFAPYGGVPTGAQAVLRSKNIYGPYEYRTVLAKGNTNVNGPHQGGYVETPDGTGWFVHFQSRGAHGRIVWLEPVRWADGWPVIGEAPDGATTGEPVLQYPMPVVLQPQPGDRPQTSDEFTSGTLSPMWEWNHNPVDTLWSLTERPGFLRLHAAYSPDLLHARNTITECLQDESAEVTVRLDLAHLAPGDRTGLSIFDRNTAYAAVAQQGKSRKIVFSSGGTETAGPEIAATSIQLRGTVTDDTASYLYSIDGGKTFVPIGGEVKLVFGWWKGARPAVFAFNTDSGASAKGYVDVDWAHYRALVSNK